MSFSKPLLFTLLKSTLLSILVFGTVSFVSVLPDFNTHVDFGDFCGDKGKAQKRLRHFITSFITNIIRL